jgi:repressor LexA
MVTFTELNPLLSIMNRHILELGLGGLQALAGMYDIPYATLYNVTRGRRIDGGARTFSKPSPKNLPKIAKALDIKVDELTYLLSIVGFKDDDSQPTSPLQMTLWNYIQNELRASVVTQEAVDEFATKYGIVPEVLQGIFYGGLNAQGELVQPPVSALQDLADVLGEPVSKLMMLYLSYPGANQMFFNRDDVRKLREGLTQEIAPVISVPLKVAGWVGAGPDQYEEADGYVYIEREFAHGRNLAAFRVRGDSMAAGKHPIYNGDLVVVDTGDIGQNTDSVVAELVSDGFVCKMLKDDRFGKQLQSRNPEHTNGTPTSIAFQDVRRIVGKVVRILHDL